MKKTIFSIMFAMVLGMTVGSCGKTAAPATANDTDTVVVDTVVADSVAVDSAVCAD